MNKSKTLSLISMFANLAVIALGILGVYFFVDLRDFTAESLKYFEILTILVTFLGAALMIWANIVSFIKKRDCTPRLFYSIRYLSAVMSLVTLICAFIDAGSNPKIVFDYESGALFLSFICPIISILQFSCLEIEPKGKLKKTLEPFIAILLYMIGILIAVFVVYKVEKVLVAVEYAPYSFFLVTKDLVESAKEAGIYKDITVGGNIAILATLVAIVYASAFVLWLLNRISHNVIIGETYQVAAPKKAAPKKAAPAPKSGNAFTNYVKKKVAFGDANNVSQGQTYHISYHNRRLKTWKVKAENAGRALKVFNTQKEAIDYANACVKKSGGSIRVHSMMGKIRKE